MHAEDPVTLNNLIQQEAGNSARWLKDNRLCVAGEKSKLLILGNSKLRKSKFDNIMSIQVDDKEIFETESEKLLGIVINNSLTWKNHLYGDSESDGLIPQLAKRIGILKKLSKRMSKSRLAQFAFGIFYSKLSYCLPVFGNVFGLEKYKETNSRYTSFTVADSNRLQVLQNKVNRLLTGAKYNTPTIDLLEETNSLSIQQMIAFQTTMMTYKILKSRKPTYLAKRMKENSGNINLRGRSNSVSKSSHSLSIAKEGFIYRGVTLINMLSDSLRSEEKID